MTMTVSKMRDYFTLSELTVSSLATREGIDNKPSQEIVEILGSTVTKLNKVRELLGYPMPVNSGYRCEALEKILCKKDYAAWCVRRGYRQHDASWNLYFSYKAHPKGYAADFTCDGFGSPVEVVRAIAESPIQFDQLIEEGTWVHISFDPQMRRQILTAKFNKDGTPDYTKTN